MRFRAFLVVLLALAMMWVPALFLVPSGRAAEAPSREQQDLQSIQAAELALQASSNITPQQIGRLAQSFRALETRYPRSAQVKAEYAAFLASEASPGEAVAKLAEAVKLEPKSADLRSRLGWMRLSNSDPAGGVADLQAAIALDPGSAADHRGLGMSLYLFRHQLASPALSETVVVDHALAELKRSTELAPDSIDYAREYAETFYSIPAPRWPDALAAWQHFHKISSDKDLGAINLARVSLQMHDSAAARNYLALVTGIGYAPLKKKLLAKAAAN